MGGSEPEERTYQAITQVKVLSSEIDIIPITGRPFSYVGKAVTG
jgi:hypothetical protein